MYLTRVLTFKKSVVNFQALHIQIESEIMKWMVNLENKINLRMIKLITIAKFLIIFSFYWIEMEKGAFC